MHDISSFERLAHQASLAVKEGKMLQATPSHIDEDNQVMRLEFEHRGFTYELIFHRLSQDPKLQIPPEFRAHDISSFEHLAHQASLAVKKGERCWRDVWPMAACLWAS